MAFDFTRAAAIPLMQPYAASPMPPPFTNTIPQGWTVNFTDSSHFDPNHSLGYIWEKDRSFICPSRSQGGTILTEAFNGPMNYYVPVLTDPRAAIGTVYINDADPAVSGLALDMQTGPTVGAVAGVMRILPTVPDTFSYFAMPRFVTGNGFAADALHIWVQNNAGKTLATRYYGGQVEVIINGAFTPTFPGGFGGDYFAEAWVCAVSKGNGTHEVGFYAGTKPLGKVTGTLPSGLTVNNCLAITQQSGLDNYRRTQIGAINVGPSQLADSMVICSGSSFASKSPTTGHFMVLVEDVSLDVAANVNVIASISKDNAATWTQVPLTNYGSWCKGEIDNTVPVWTLAGDIPFAPGSGRNMRWVVEVMNGCLGALQGATMFWD